MSDLPMLDAALAYARRGWHVFPCAGDDGKKPLTTHGFKDGSTDVFDIELWWKHNHPGANVAVATGDSGLAIIDVDDDVGFANFEDEHGQLPPTMTVATPSGGVHFIYTGDIKSTTSKLAPGIDTRGRGGYAVLPPSYANYTKADGRHIEGHYKLLNDLEPAPLPEWVAELADPPRPEPREQAPLQHTTVQVNDAWAQRALDGEIARVATAREGTRNAALFQAACNLFEIAKGGHMSADVVRGQLQSVAERIGLDAGEIRKSLDSAWERTGERHPLERERPERPAPDPAPLPPREPAEHDEDDEQTFDLLSLQQLRDMPPPQWLLPNRVPAGMTWVIGQPKSTKTFLTLDWAATIAARGKRVIYFVGEGVNGFAQRVDGWAKRHPQADMSRLHIVNRAVQLLDPTQARMLYATVRKSQADLIVLDTWSRCTVGADENSHTDTSRAIHVLDQCREAYGTSALVVHHTNASGARSRGHTSIEGAADAIWKVVKDEESAGIAEAHNVAMKDAEEHTPLLYRLVQGQDGRPYVEPSVYDRNV